MYRVRERVLSGAPVLKPWPFHQLQAPVAWRCLPLYAALRRGLASSGKAKERGFGRPFS